MTPPHVHVRWLNWVAILLPAGSLLGGKETEDLIEAARRAITDHFQGLVLNVAQVKFMNSSGAGSILFVQTLCERVGAKMAICCERSGSISILRAVAPSIPWFDTEEEAVRYCSKR